MQDGEIVVEKYGEKASGTYDSFLKDLAVKDENGKDACRLDWRSGVFEAASWRLDWRIGETLD